MEEERQVKEGIRGREKDGCQTNLAGGLHSVFTGVRRAALKCYIFLPWGHMFDTPGVRV